MKFFKTMKTAIGTKCGRVTLKLKKHAPEIMVVSGVIGITATIVLACKETLKLEAIVDEAGDTLFEINDTLENEKVVENEDGTKSVYSEKDAQHDKTIVYVKTGAKILKNYAPAIGLGILSLTLILAGHNILRKRNVALMGAYNALQKSYETYRERVIDKYGQEADDFCLNIESPKEDKNKNDNSMDSVTINNISPYSILFDEYCKEWKKSADYNAAFLRCQERAANDMLHYRGHLFLNEVYDMVGAPRTKEGAIVGWILGDKSSHGFVSFGLDKHYADWDNYVGMNCNERSYRLDFNVDGVIYDKI